MSSPVAPAWIAADGPNPDIVLSTRARVARNVAALPFPARASRAELKRVAELVTSAARRISSLGYAISIIRIDDLAEPDKINLVDAHVVSPEHLNGGPERLVILEPGGQAAIMVNEEDHLRIQSVLSGLAPEEAWRRVDEIDEELSRSLEFGYSERFGYLTASLTNVGTGLRVSALMHLGGLAILGKLRTTLRAARELGVSVRGMFGEGSAGLGDFYQVSNEVTLGLEEKEIVGRVKAVAGYLLEEERRARSLALEEQGPRLAAMVRESLKVLFAARSISAGEALRLLSPIRVACSAAAVGGVSLQALNRVLAAMKLRHNTSARRSRFDLARDDVERASLLKETFKNADVTAYQSRFV